MALIGTGCCWHGAGRHGKNTGALVEMWAFTVEPGLASPLVVLTIPVGCGHYCHGLLSQHDK